MWHPELQLHQGGIKVGGGGQPKLPLVRMHGHLPHTCWLGRVHEGTHFSEKSGKNEGQKVLGSACFVLPIHLRPKASADVATGLYEQSGRITKFPGIVLRTQPLRSQLFCERFLSLGTVFVPAQLPKTQAQSFSQARLCS